jgi:2-C-methyl-D-erythritol 4-phosphate cytidylyltransferase
MTSFDPTFAPQFAHELAAELVPASEVTSRLIALVPAAGVGARATVAGEIATPKQYRIVAGQPMLRHAVLALLADPRIDEVRVIVSPEDAHAREVLADLPRTHCCPVGGATRSDTVLNGLKQAGIASSDWVLVHDAARPGLPQTALGRLIDACLADGVGGLLAIPVADTVKFADGQGRVARTVDRAQLWAAQTPQMFRAGLLLAALIAQQQSGATPTDEAQAMEAAGFQPLLIPGSGRNAKITWPDDFEWVESWL